MVDTEEKNISTKMYLHFIDYIKISAFSFSGIPFWPPVVIN